MRSARYRLLDGRSAKIHWDRSVAWSGNGALEIVGTTQVYAGVRFDLLGGGVRLGHGATINCYTLIYQEDGVMEIGEN